jgi:hypothetical protein
MGSWGADNSKIILKERPIYEKKDITGSATSTVQDVLSEGKSMGLTVRMEYESCRPGEGPSPDGSCEVHDVEINAFGKPHSIKSKKLNRFEINNTKYDAKVTFKLCLGGTSIASSGKDR